MTAIPLTVLPTSGFPSTVKPTTASIKIDWWMFVSFGTSFFGYYCLGFSRCGFATHGFPMCGPSICDSFRSDTTKKQAHMRIAVVPAVHIWALIVDFWLHPHRCFSCLSLCKVVIRILRPRHSAFTNFVHSPVPAHGRPAYVPLPAAFGWAFCVAWSPRGYPLDCWAAQRSRGRFAPSAGTIW